VFIIIETTKKFLYCGLRISAGFIHNGILLLQNLWRILRRRGSIRRRHWRRSTWWRMRLKSVCSWWILKRRRGSVRRLWRMSLFSSWILRRMRGSVMRLWRMKMWRRMMLKSLFSWWILRRSGSVRRRV
jgi:hypothetical protein